MEHTLTIQRYGMLSDRSIGLVDDLELSYSGNRPLGVTDYAQPVLLESSLDFDAGDDGEALYSYDADGRLISDTGRGITSISYTPGNLPVRTTVKGGTFDCSYSADGRKLKTVTDYLANVAVAGGGTSRPGFGVPKDSITNPGGIGGKLPITKSSPEERYYIGPFELVKPAQSGFVLFKTQPGLARINMSWGYFDSEGNNNEYVTDYQGNVRAVTRGDEVVQTTDYYPYGLPMANSTGAAANRYKYTGKEFETRAGLNTFDFHARQYGPAVPLLDSTDPKAGDYHNLSPFLFCAANPILNIDPTGMVIEEACMDTWEEFKEEIRKQKELYIQEYNKYEDLLEKTSDKKEFYALMSSFKAIYKSLETTLNSMKSLEDSQQVYTLNKAKENIGDITYDVSSDVLSINYVNIENFVHEVTHAAQFEKGEIAFIDGLPFCYDIFDELKAYKAQDAFRGEKPNNRKIDSINDAIYINQSIGEKPLNINSTYKDFQKAFPGKDILLKFKRAKDIPGIKYRH